MKLTATKTHILRIWYMLVLAIRLNTAESFQWTKNHPGSFYYDTFPAGFLWGVGSSAYQTEGAWDKDGKGPSIWDAFTHKKGKVFRNETGDSACDGYYKVKDDIQLLKELKVNHYLFSISWPRIMPTGIKTEQLNEKGIQFYNDTINSLLENNITPIVSLYHWDLPQVLQEKYGGWQNISMINYFNDYANLCFEKFGDRVKHWITFSNPWAVAEKGYETGEHAPGLKLGGCGAYRAAHHIIKTHAKVWHSYNNTWRSEQQGMVGISLTSGWGEPVDPHSQADIEAAERYIQFHLGWFANPIYRGDYPEIMKNYVGQKSAQQGLGTSRLPTFSLQEKTYIKGTSDFLGIGHFTTRYVLQRSFPLLQASSYHTDRDLAELVDPNWPVPGPNWLYSVPWGFRRLLNFIKTQYGNPLIYVTENGVSEKEQCTQLCDEWRIEYLKGYINEMLKALNDGVNVKGYTAWSLLDKFEWNKGFSERFGFYHVDFKHKNKPRYPKASADFYKKIISANGFPNPREISRRKITHPCYLGNNKEYIYVLYKMLFDYKKYIVIKIKDAKKLSENCVERIKCFQHNGEMIRDREEAAVNESVFQTNRTAACQPSQVRNWYRKAMDTCSTAHQHLATGSLITPMEMLSEIVLPTVFALCILISIVLLTLYLRSRR